MEVGMVSSAEMERRKKARQAYITVAVPRAAVAQMKMVEEVHGIKKSAQLTMLIAKYLEREFPVMPRSDAASQQSLFEAAN